MEFAPDYINLEQNLEFALENKWSAKAIPIAGESLEIKEKMFLYHDDKYSNYWNIREILLRDSINYSELSQFIYMRYGGDDLARKTLEDLNTLDSNKSYRILNAGSGFGSDMIAQAKMLPNAKFCGIEFNKRYADLSAKIIQALGLEEQIKIYNANLTDHDHIKEIQAREGLFDGAYSNLVVLHIKNKAALYQSILTLLKPGAIYRNEDYTRQELTNHKFAEEKIGCQNLMTIEEMIQLAQSAGFCESSFSCLTDYWREFTLQRKKNYFENIPKRSKKKEIFFQDVAEFFSNQGGCGGVFRHIK
ncbi:methyltransferase domain-containing protein [Fluviispira vulneris]|uniref:methyltransferase domain-containing protein n=1 Tax=Fluviispira vulneris TaxID=2763012 RepID=UPI0016444081|nr:methyltransferase domain-containing protein [Fluviispira vulneris]